MGAPSSIWVAHWEWLDHTGTKRKSTKAFLTKKAADSHRPRYTLFIGSKYEGSNSKSAILLRGVTEYKNGNGCPCYNCVEGGDFPTCNA